MRFLRTMTLIVGTLLAVPGAALAQKPGGGARASEVGDNLADLLTENLTQLLVVLVGVFGIAAVMSRSMGQALMIVVVGLIAGMFIVEPDIALSIFRGVYQTIA